MIAPHPHTRHEHERRWYVADQYYRRLNCQPGAEDGLAGRPRHGLIVWSYLDPVHAALDAYQATSGSEEDRRAAVTRALFERQITDASLNIPFERASYSQVRPFDQFAGWLIHYNQNYDRMFPL